eukprot:Skav223185  [mRNA]  locus=scaffold2044:303182:304908:+ [translate_table: standard]
MTRQRKRTDRTAQGIHEAPIPSRLPHFRRCRLIAIRGRTSDTARPRFEDLELLHNLGIHTEWVQHNARPGTLYDEAGQEASVLGPHPPPSPPGAQLPTLQALRYEKGSAILSTGALAAFSGAKTGRSPLDKRVVLEPGGPVGTQGKG